MSTLTIVLLIAVAVYLARCWWRPYRSCPWCGNKTTDRDKRGNYRHKRQPRGLHRWLHPEPEYRRPVARLFGWR